MTQQASLLELEEPILRAKDLAMAVHCFASSDPMRGEVGGALSALAETLMDEIDLIKERWLEARDAYRTNDDGGAP